MRQSAKVLSIKDKINVRHVQSYSEHILRTGDKAIVKFRFTQHPEFIKTGTNIMFAEGKIKIVGIVTKIY